MDERRRVEDWADAMLDQHRTAPHRDPIEDDPVIDHMLRRAKRYGALQRRFANLEAAAVLLGTILLAIFLLAFHGGF